MTTISRPGRKSRDELIRKEVLRRLDAGEPVNYRAIHGAVGGSTATIRRVLASLDLAGDARGNAQREIELRERVREAGTRVAEAEAYVQGAREAGEALAREITGVMGTVRDAHTMLLREIDTLRTLAGELRRELAANRPAQTGDPLLEARLRKAHDENGRMAATIEKLKRQMHEAGVDPA